MSKYSIKITKINTTICFVILCFLLTACGPMLISPAEGTRIHSKYQKYIEQCAGENEEICVQRYDNIIINKSLKKRARKVKKNTPSAPISNKRQIKKGATLYQF